MSIPLRLLIATLPWLSNIMYLLMYKMNMFMEASLTIGNHKVIEHPLCPTPQCTGPCQCGDEKDDSMPVPVVDRVRDVTEITVRTGLTVLCQFFIVEGGVEVQLSDVQVNAAATADPAGQSLGHASHGLHHLGVVGEWHPDLQGYRLFYLTFHQKLHECVLRCCTHLACTGSPSEIS